MEAATAALTALAPLVAIVLEWQHPIEEYLGKQQAETIVTELGLAESGGQNDEFRSGLVEVISYTALGAAAAANLILTAVTFIAGAVAIFYEVVQSLWLMLAVAAFLFMGLISYIRFGSETFLDIATVYVGMDVGMDNKSRVTRREQFSWVVYGLNVLLLIGCGLVYWGTNGQYVILPETCMGIIGSCGKLDEDGRLAIPAALRSKLDLQPGAEVLIVGDEGALHIRPLDKAR